MQRRCAAVRGDVGHDNDIDDDDDGELTFLLLYTVVLLPILCTPWARILDFISKNLS